MKIYLSIHPSSVPACPMHSRRGPEPIPKATGQPQGTHFIQQLQFTSAWGRGEPKNLKETLVGNIFSKYYFIQRTILCNQIALGENNLSTWPQLDLWAAELAGIRLNCDPISLFTSLATHTTFMDLEPPHCRYYGLSQEYYWKHTSGRLEYCLIHCHYRLNTAVIISLCAQYLQKARVCGRHFSAEF